MNKENLDDDNYELDEDDTVDDLKAFSSERLSDIIITYRYFGLNKEKSLEAMKELAARRSAGNDFNYENYIDKNLKELPSLKLDIKNIDAFMSKLKVIKNVK